MLICGEPNCPNRTTAQTWPCPLCRSGGQWVQTYPPKPTGWRCPVCGKGNAPHADKCGHCADRKPTYAETVFRDVAQPENT